MHGWEFICNGIRTEWIPIRSERFVASMITDRTGRHEVLLPINHKNFNFKEKKNGQVMKERGNFHKKTDKGDRRKHSETISPPTYLGAKNTKPSARKHVRNSNFECDWLI